MTRLDIRPKPTIYSLSAKYLILCLQCKFPSFKNIPRHPDFSKNVADLHVSPASVRPGLSMEVTYLSSYANAECC